MKILTLSIVIILLLSNCSSIFLPKSQKITINTGQNKAITYIDNIEIGKGEIIKIKVKKNGTKQVIIKTQGYKDTYRVLFQTHRPAAYWPLTASSAIIPVYGLASIADNYNEKCMSFDKVNNFIIIDKSVNRGEQDKYIDLEKICLSIKDKDEDIHFFKIKYSKDSLLKKMDALINLKVSIDKKYKEKNKKFGVLKDFNDVKNDDIKFSEQMNLTLKKTGFIDTVNKVFCDHNNTLVLEGNVKKIYVFNIRKKQNDYLKAKLLITWYVKNTYNEVLDSIESKDYSGDFIQPTNYRPYYNLNNVDNIEIELYEKMYGDAIELSYLKLHKNENFTKYLKQETDFEIKEEVLNIIKPSDIVLEKIDAAQASVIVKRKDGGHGSGFVISNDGYIITNYHVMAGKTTSNTEPLKIITNEGQELDVAVVRVNKYRDLALLKVTKTFQKAFFVSSTKTFKNMQDAFTIGAPKSVELGQSISAGVISNERKANNNNLLQLGMSINAGNSGGPLYDETGKLHGVIVSKLVGENTEGVSFAIPGYLIEEYLKIKIN
jgi:S1-C subfamily serine protease